MSQRGALLAVGLYYLVYYAFGYWHLAQPEGFLTPVVLLAVWFYDQAAAAKRPTIILLISGFTVALAPWFKQTAVVFIAALLAWAVYEYWAGRKWPRVIAPILGGALVANGLILGFTAVTGMFNPMLDAFNYAFFDYPDLERAGLTEIASLTVSWGIWFPALIFPFLAGLGYLLINRSFWPRWIGLILMGLAGLASVYIQQKLWVYHWVSSLPFMVLIGAFSLESSLTYLQALSDKKQKSVVWLFAFACISLVLPILDNHLAYDVNAVSYLFGRTSRADYLEEFELLDVVETADYLAARTGEDEPIFVWGHYAMIYYLADRPNPTRFINDPPLSLPHGRQAKWRQEVMVDLAADPPTYIVIATDDTTDFEPKTSEEQLPDFPALADFIASRYQLETTIGSFELYRLN
jgi:hypothetical protein